MNILYLYWIELLNTSIDNAPYPRHEIFYRDGVFTDISTIFNKLLQLMDIPMLWFIFDSCLIHWMHHMRSIIVITIDRVRGMAIYMWPLKWLALLWAWNLVRSCALVGVGHLVKIQQTVRSNLHPTNWWSCCSFCTKFTS